MPIISTAFRRDWTAHGGPKLSTRRLYINDLFLELVRRPLQGKIGSVDRLRQRFAKVAAPLDTSRYELQQLNQPRDARECRRTRKLSTVI
jgi:type IV secretory pathway VirB4 component